MKVSSFLVVAAFHCLLCFVNWIVGVPLANSWDASGSNNSTQNQDIHYNDDPDHYIIIDDMVIQSDPTRAGFVNYNWPNGIVPYRYNSSITATQRTQITQAMGALQSISCIVFRPATAEDSYNLLFKNDPGSGCSSFIGWANMIDQPVQLETGCSVGNAVHELLHALGFFHEQTRDDRDNYVRINFDNIEPGVERNFQKDSELFPNIPTSYFNVPYNYESIMHYGKTFFSRNGENTIDPLYNPNALGNGDDIGQRDHISTGDQQMLRRKYNCPDENQTQGTTATTPRTTTTTPRTTTTTERIPETTTRRRPICVIFPALCRSDSSEEEVTGSE